MMENASINAALAASDCWSDVSGASFTVVGLGKSGISAANALCRRGADVFCMDDKPEAELQGALKALDARIQVQCGGGPLGRRGDLFILSPGIAPHTRLFRDIRGVALAMLSEVELFYRLDRAALDGRGHPMAAISGTDGKTTTTLWTAHLLAAGGLHAVVGGNIGDPLCDFLDDLKDNDVIVAEISGFQLLTCSALRPRVAVVTNIAADHVDYFSGDTEAYITTKMRVQDRMGPGDAFFINADDPELEPHRQRLQAGVPFAWSPFSTQGVPERGLGFDGVNLCWSLGKDACVPILPAAELGSLGRHPITGLHNVENALSAVGMALALGVPLDAIRQGLRTFSLPAHRIEPVGAIGQVRFVDDSKATNPHAAIAGLRAMQLAAGDKLVWVGGGSDKEADFAELGSVVAELGATALLIGQTAGAIDAVLPASVTRERCQSLEEAVARGLQLASPAGVVLLSPACASYDMFRSYVHRGEVFATAVQRLSAAIAGH